MKISARQSTRRQTIWATINRAIGVGQLGDHTPNILRVLRMCLFWLICTEDLCLLCCDRRQ